MTLIKKYTKIHNTQKYTKIKKAPEVNMKSFRPKCKAKTLTFLYYNFISREKIVKLRKFVSIMVVKIIIEKIKFWTSGMQTCY